MTNEQLRRLLETHGADLARWDITHRESARRLIEDNPHARDLYLSAQALDDALDRYEPTINTRHLHARIMAGLPEQRRSTLDAIVDWLVPQAITPGTLLRPVLAASLPLVLGIVLGSQLQLGIDTATDTWQYELQLMALAEPGTESLP